MRRDAADLSFASERRARRKHLLRRRFSCPLGTEVQNLPDGSRNQTTKRKKRRRWTKDQRRLLRVSFVRLLFKSKLTSNQLLPFPPSLFDINTMSNRLLSRSLLSLSSKRSSSSSKVGGVLFLNSSKRSFSITSTSLGEFTIPVVDFGRFLNSKTQAEKEDAAKQVVDALVERGFMVSSRRPRGCDWERRRREGGEGRKLRRRGERDESLLRTL